MIEINTKAWNRIEIDERQIIQFPSGILGFESFRKFALLDAAQPPFYWLQSLDMKEIAFVMIDPKIFRPDYKLILIKEEFEDLGFSSFPDENSLLFTIVTIPENQARMTANLQGPVVINRDTRVGRQFINNDPRWKTKHYILDELASVRNEAC